MPNSTPANAAPPQPKPIRFVTNHDGPYAKRRRINSACLTCRKKKTRCSGERPVCGTCKQNKHECAGYGAEAGAAQADGKKDGKKKEAREGNNSSTAPPRKPKQEAPETPRSASAAARPTVSHAPSQASHNGSSTANTSLPRPGREQHSITYNTDAVQTSARQPILSLSTRTRMPYFRYFGPTAIMPGFKQMVVKVRGKQHSTGHTSSDAIESSPGQPPPVGSPPAPEFRTPVDLPVYDTSTIAPSPLITHLCKLFVVHFGCCFPFIQPERFLRDLEEKQVDAILVDAVCALAARFSTHPLLTAPSTDGQAEEGKMQPWEYGQAFAQRAKSAISDAFHCPSVAVVQAALLLAYDEFGASRDSGLWMYLGIAIRMAQDLGMQTVEGLRYEGREGPTPSSVKNNSREAANSAQSSPGPRQLKGTGSAEEEQRSVERERLDTFWCIFFLDRVISSGTGRPVTLRDKEIEISFPSLDELVPNSDWPLPFPALIRIIHLYGQVTDLLNGIKEQSHMTEDLRKRLDTLEYHLTEIYQGLSPRLHFNALNFQHYVKLNQGTNFLLLHCWFHTLIVLLHQPTLLKTFEGSVMHLANNSRELSMSSAKTVADILAFTELIDAKAGVGNPFTSQPIYIGACAFLKETALHSASSQPHSRPDTPGAKEREQKSYKQSLDHLDFDNFPKPSTSNRFSHLSDYDQKQAQKHTLLASAANQNYQRCYRALKSLETYWAGVKYILTVLDQKAKGVGDPLLYTREEMESALEVPRPEPSFTSPGWRRKLSWGSYLTAENVDIRKTALTPKIPVSPLPLASQAIGWSLTGTMNSPSTKVAVMYKSDATNDKEAKTRRAKTEQPSIGAVLASTVNDPREMGTTMASSFPPSASGQQSFNPAEMPPPSANFPQPDAALVSDADLLLNFHSPFTSTSPSTMSNPNIHRPPISSSAALPGAIPNAQQHAFPYSPTFIQYAPNASDNLGNMVIDSQDVDMSTLGADMMPWDLEYLPHDFMFYEDPGSCGTGEGG